MPRALPIELRERIVQAHLKHGMPADELAEIFSVSVASVRRYLAKDAAGESLEPGVAPGGKPKLSDTENTWLQAELEADPFLTSYELCARFNKAFRCNQVHRSTILRAIHKFGFTYKKKRRTRRSASATTS